MSNPRTNTTALMPTTNNPQPTTHNRAHGNRQPLQPTSPQPTTHIPTTNNPQPTTDNSHPHYNAPAAAAAASGRAFSDVAVSDETRRRSNSANDSGVGRSRTGFGAASCDGPCGSEAIASASVSASAVSRARTPSRPCASSSDHRASTSSGERSKPKATALSGVGWWWVRSCVRGCVVLRVRSPSPQNNESH